MLGSSELNLDHNSYGEFDPGSERTLAACLTHASRARKGTSVPEYSGERVSNTWVIYPQGGNNPGKPGLIPDKTTEGNFRGQRELRPPPEDEPAAYQLVGEVTAHQGEDG